MPIITLDQKDKKFNIKMFRKVGVPQNPFKTSITFTRRISNGNLKHINLAERSVSVPIDIKSLPNTFC